MHPHSTEIEYLKRLIEEFPSGYKPDEALKAYTEVAAKFQFYEQNVRLLADIQLELAKEPGRNIGGVLHELSYQTHAFLFENILSNAGKVRSPSDSNSGRIHFGGQKHQQLRPRFDGTSPSHIQQELEDAFSQLNANPDDPVKQALQFYQHFVKIHPFYDANGRIGRLIVSVYLYSFDYYVLWSKFDGPNNAKFIKKLNNCHSRMASGHTFEEYFHYLYQFFKEFVITINELEDFNG